MGIPLREGFSVTLFGKPFRVLNILPDKAVILLNERTSAIKQLSFYDIGTYRQQGALKIVEGQDILFREDGLPPIPAALPDHHRQELQRRLRYVQAILEKTTTFSRPHQVTPITQAVSQQIKDSHPPCASSAYRWCHAYVSSGEDIMSLVPKTANCGRRHGQIHQDVIELFYETIDSFYLTRSRHSRRQTHDEFADRIIEANQQRSKNDWLRPVSYSGFCKLIKRLLDPFIVMARRFGEKMARRQFRTRRAGPIALFPLERVEIDHTRLDIIVIDPITKQPLNRPTCTVAIDKRTRMVCGIYIDLEPPSSIAVLMCLRQAVSSKQPILECLPNGKSFTWPVAGQFRIICMDNGPEFHGKSHKQFCEDMHADMQYCPPGKPWYKAGVERFLGTLNRRLIHQLPGTTWSNIVERGDYPSEKLASLTLHELRELVFRWVVMDYHNTRHSELGETPLQCWSRLINEHPIPPLPTSLSLEIETGLTFEKIISNGRISTSGLIYHHPYLIHLQKKLPAKQKIILRIDPENVDQAYIYDPINKALIKLECLTTGIEPGTTWLEFKKSRKTSDTDVVEDMTPDADTLRQEKAKLRRDVHQRHQEAEKTLQQRKRSKAPGKKPRKSNAQIQDNPAPQSDSWSDESLAAEWFIDHLELKGEPR